jgi:hypothetical protein
MNKPTPQEAARALTDFLNSSMDDDVDEFVATIMREHRTLQQQTMDLFLRMCKGWCEMYAKGFYDLRNEATVRDAVKIATALDGNMRESYI